MRKKQQKGCILQKKLYTLAMKQKRRIIGKQVNKSNSSVPNHLFFNICPAVLIYISFISFGKLV